ncbi:hypothetical protein [Paludibacterium sp.]|uniref:hypothetical protein n=1 Tax=Paludibacterium sp. TaxID=1917523 RepID=UPI0025E5DA7B|nr:hypothetical protein [Paludibacterium sp.]
MAVVHGNAVSAPYSNQRLRQQQLLSLIAVLCEPRPNRSSTDMRRLIVDSRLNWSVAPVDATTSWLYLPQAVRAREIAGCLVLTAD